MRYILSFILGFWLRESNFGLVCFMGGPLIFEEELLLDLDKGASFLNYYLQWRKNTTSYAMLFYIMKPIKDSMEKNWRKTKRCVLSSSSRLLLTLTY